MPNEVTNILSIKGPRNIIAKFLEDNIENDSWKPFVAKSIGVYQNEYHTRVERKSQTHIVVYFLTSWTPSVEWVEDIAPLWPQLDFNLVWYEIGALGYGYHRVYSHGGIKEYATYSVDYGDIVGVDEDGNIDEDDDDAPSARSAGRFQNVLDRVDHIYEESRW